MVDDGGKYKFYGIGYPEVLFNGRWSPICGSDYFWENNNGATLFCKQLNPKFKSGVVIKRKDKKLVSDALRVGLCKNNDQWLKCTGGGNDLKYGRVKWNVWNGCEAGDLSSMKIECSYYKGSPNSFKDFFLSSQVLRMQNSKVDQIYGLAWWA